jgi:hypothetical protein
MKPIEFCSPDDRFYDYCLWEYKPIASPENKFRSANLLYHSFQVGAMDERAFALVDVLRNSIGMFNTVWGVKYVEGRLRWEYYFCDYRRRRRERSITRVLEALQPYVKCNVKANENLDYFMFSLDMNEDLIAGTRDLDEIHLYIGNPGSTVSSGICYSVTNSGTKLENFYFFFDVKRQIEQIAGKVCSSAFFDDTKMDINALLWPELKECGVIVVANKQRNDSLYFSRITVDQLLFFMRKLDYPALLVSFVEANRMRLDHLLYDVGFDYRIEGEDLVILKSGYYGIF